MTGPFSILFTIVILFVTEIIPKVIGVSHNERLAPVLAPILSFITTALYPVVVVTEWLSKPFKKNGSKRAVSIADLQTMADMAESEKTIEVEQENIIINATRLHGATVSSVMVPRERIAFFQIGRSNIDNFAVAATTLHTRFPVSENDTVDGIIGYVNFKELVASAPSRREVQVPQFIRPLARLRADANLNEALKILLGRRGHMILVEDEQNRVVGLLTLEDVLEEIVGDLQDEFDTASSELIQVAPNRWKVGGAVSMGDLAARLHRPLTSSDPHQNLSAWMQERVAGELNPGNIVQDNGTTFTIILTRRHKAHRVLIETDGDQPTPGN